MDTQSNNNKKAASNSEDTKENQKQTRFNGMNEDIQPIFSNCPVEDPDIEKVVKLGYD